MTPALQQAISLHRAGQLEQAESLYRQILSREPYNPDALHFLGLLLDQRGDHEQGIQLIQQAIAISPSVPHYHNNLGEAFRKARRFAEAESAFKLAISIRPDNALSWYNLGLVLAEQKQFDPAVDAYHRALGLNRQFAEAYNNLAIALVALDRKEQAIAAYKAAIETAPQTPFSYVNLAMLLARLKRHDEAIPLAQKAVALNPAHAEAHYNLGLLYAEQLRYAEAIGSYLKAIELNPRHALAHNNVGNLYRELGEPDRAIELIRRSFALHFDPELHVNLIAALYHSPHVHPLLIREEHERWAERVSATPPQSNWPNDRAPDRRLRIGYVSPDLREHSVAYFLEPVLANHDREQFEIFCYSDVKSPDDFTARLQSHAHTWRDVANLTDTQLAGRIGEDRIDILIDLAGHTTGSRLLVFAQKPAPIQMTYLGYPNTTGLKQIDYRITDGLADPTASDVSSPPDCFYTEKLIRLPETFLCYRIPRTLPDVSPLPALTTHTVTFGSFNPISKINPDVARLWARVLSAIPNSRLIIKSQLLHDQPTRALVAGRLASEGIAADRVELLARTKSHQEHIALYEKIDIALDPFPYNGTTTTCEALAMGVPVITLAGTSHISRVGVSLLSNVGLHNLIARDPDDYVEIAKALASDLPALAELRRTLRERMRRSPLCDEPRFTWALESAYREAWKRWLQSEDHSPT